MLIKMYKFEFKPFCVVLFYKLTTLVKEGNEGFANGVPHLFLFETKSEQKVTHR